jgi:hypothetical protein
MQGVEHYTTKCTATVIVTTICGMSTQQHNSGRLVASHACNWYTATIGQICMQGTASEHARLVTAQDNQQLQWSRTFPE